MKIKEKAIQVRCSQAFKNRILSAARYYNLSISSYIITLINKNLKELDK